MPKDWGNWFVISRFFAIDYTVTRLKISSIIPRNLLCSASLNEGSTVLPSCRQQEPLVPNQLIVFFMHSDCLLKLGIVHVPAFFLDFVHNFSLISQGKKLLAAGYPLV